MTFLIGALIGAFVCGLISHYYGAPPHPMVLALLAAGMCMLPWIPGAIR